MSQSIDPASILIRPLNDGDSIAELTELLHRAYKRLADMGLRYVASYQTEETTRERISHGQCFVAVAGNRLIATVTYYGPEHRSDVVWYNRDDVAYFGQFAVEPELQRLGVGAMLMDYLEAKATADGAAEISLDTSESATHLIAYYTRRGYRFIEYQQWDVTNYRSMIFSKQLI
jgi:ribosomal protein S18 acetylase RimI-like enzyme